MLDLIHPHILVAAAEGRCLLVFDASPEGDAFIEQAYIDLHLWLEAKGISKSNVLLLTQNRALSDQYRLRFNEGIAFCVYDSFLKKLLSIFGQPDNEFQKLVGFSKDHIAYREGAIDKKTFLSLNGAPRRNRIVFVAGMLSKGLLADSEWSMLGDKSKKLSVNVDLARHFRDVNNIQSVSDSDIDTVISAMPKFIDIEATSMNNIRGSDDLALRINPDLFDAAFCSIATETEFTDGDVLRISELSLKPFAMGHPVVLFGNPYSLKLVKSLGFETFDRIFSEEYDEITSITDRFAAVFDTLEQVRLFQRNADTAKRRLLADICQHNIDVAGSGAAARNYEKIYERQLSAALSGQLARLAAA